MEALDAARMCIQRSFTRAPNQRGVLTAARVFRNLEQIVGMGKSEWNAGLVRSLWPTVESRMGWRKESVDYEETWLIVAGFLLRPGFGAAADNFRIDSLGGCATMVSVSRANESKARSIFSGGA
jgi:hypothetical protein